MCRYAVVITVNVGTARDTFEHLVGGERRTVGSDDFGCRDVADDHDTVGVERVERRAGPILLWGSIPRVIVLSPSGRK
jgi:hypothetical protein